MRKLIAIAAVPLTLLIGIVLIEGVFGCPSRRRLFKRGMIFTPAPVPSH